MAENQDYNSATSTKFHPQRAIVRRNFNVSVSLPKIQIGKNVSVNKINPLENNSSFDYTDRSNQRHLNNEIKKRKNHISAINTYIYNLSKLPDISKGDFS